MGAKGYERTRASKNGFHCFVERAGTGTLAPVCYDAEGSKTLLKARFRMAELVRAGKGLEEAASIVDAEFASGELQPPSKTGIAYMLSKEFQDVDQATGERKNLYPPHVMIYAPYRTNAELGFTKEQIGSTEHPWILQEGTPSAYIIVVPKD